MVMAQPLFFSLCLPNAMAMINCYYKAGVAIICQNSDSKNSLSSTDDVTWNDHQREHKSKYMPKKFK